MSSASPVSDIIILLSRDKVDIRLQEGGDRPRSIGPTSYPIRNIFLADQVAMAMDQALIQHPGLVDQFENVDVLLVDLPGVIIPSYYAEGKQLANMAGRYLRTRSGDTISSDATTSEAHVAYSIATETLATLKEYYANAGPLHLMSILWSNLSTHERLTEGTGKARLYFLVLDDVLVVLGEEEGKLMFARNFRVYGPGDLIYFALACSRMLHAEEHWQITLDGESAMFTMPYTSFFTFHHHLELPGLHELIARHRSCVS